MALEMSLIATGLFTLPVLLVWRTRKARREYGASVGAVQGFPITGTVRVESTSTYPDQVCCHRLPATMAADGGGQLGVPTVFVRSSRDRLLVGRATDRRKQ